MAATLRQLRKERDLLLKRKAKSDERRALKSEIRDMKYGNVIGGFKSIGKGLGGAAMKYGEYYNRNSQPQKPKTQSSGGTAYYGYYKGKRIKINPVKKKQKKTQSSPRQSQSNDYGLGSLGQGGIF